MKRLALILAVALSFMAVSCNKEDNKAKVNLAGTTWTGTGDVTESIMYFDKDMRPYYQDELCTDTIKLEFKDTDSGTYYRDAVRKEDGKHMLSDERMLRYDIKGNTLSVYFMGGDSPEDCVRTATLENSSTITFIEKGVSITLKKK